MSTITKSLTDGEQLQKFVDAVAAHAGYSEQPQLGWAPISLAGSGRSTREHKRANHLKIMRDTSSLVA